LTEEQGKIDAVRKYLNENPNANANGLTIKLCFKEDGINSKNAEITYA